jgi:hypothetical protein
MSESVNVCSTDLVFKAEWKAIHVKSHGSSAGRPGVAKNLQHQFGACDSQQLMSVWDPLQSLFIWSSKWLLQSFILNSEIYKNKQNTRKQKTNPLKARLVFLLFLDGKTWELNLLATLMWGYLEFFAFCTYCEYSCFLTEKCDCVLLWGTVSSLTEDIT